MNSSLRRFRLRSKILLSLVAAFVLLGGVTEADWSRIAALLHASWQSLHKAVNS